MNNQNKNLIIGIQNLSLNQLEYLVLLYEERLSSIFEEPDFSLTEYQLAKNGVRILHALAFLTKIRDEKFNKLNNNDKITYLENLKKTLDLGLEPEIDKITDYGKGTKYYTYNGKQVAAIEDVMIYEQSFYDKMFVKENIYNERNKRYL